MQKRDQTDVVRVLPVFYRHIKLIGDGWMLIILSELSKGGCRFNELHRRVRGISPVTLTNRLKKLESLGLIVRTAKIEDRLSVAYCVTEKGNALKPIITAICAYGEAYLSEDAADTIK